MEAREKLHYTIDFFLGYHFLGPDVPRQGGFLYSSGGKYAERAAIVLSPNHPTHDRETCIAGGKPWGPLNQGVANAT